jgi:anti-sigma B factor antagonist
MSNLQVRVIKEGDVAVVQVYGAIDTLVAYTFQEKMNTLIQAGTYKYIIDCEHLEYISSAGIGIFPALAPELEKHHGKLIFAQVPEKIYKLFNLIGLAVIFKIRKTIAQAMEEFTPDA